jgi:hypothetical protein
MSRPKKVRPITSASLEAVMEYLEVLGPGDGEAALLLVLKAARIRHNAELVETWLASVNANGSEQ